MKIATSMMASLVAIVASGAASAQSSDVVVMRRVIANPTKPPFQGGLVPVKDPVLAAQYHWEKSDWYTPDAACSSTAPETRLVGCVKDYKQAEDGMCSGAGPKPETERVVSGNFDSCTFEWVKTGEQSCATSDRPSAYLCLRSDGTTMPEATCASVPGRASTCTSSWRVIGTEPSQNHCTAHQQLPNVAACVASDGSIMPDGRCTGAKPQGTSDVPDLTGCTYKWNPGEYGAWKDQCSASTTRTRSVQCQRSDGTGASSSSLCTMPKPDEQETGANYSGCGYSWKPGAWGTPDSTCSNTATQTRTSTCVRDIDQVETTDLTLCTGEKPVGTQTVPSLDGCGFDWVRGDFGDWSSTCSVNATRTRTIQCRRTDGAINDLQGNAFATVTQGVIRSSKCVKDEPGALSETQEVTSSCAYEWKTTDWKLDGEQCSATGTHSRVVTCTRTDGKPVADDMCVAADKPAATGTVENYSGCTFAWANSFSAWDSTCSDAAHRTNTPYCRRSNGSVEPDQTKCTGVKPDATETLPVYDGCSSDWATSEYGPYTTACTPTKTRSRTVQCMTQFPSGSQVAKNSGVCTKDRPSETDTPVDNSTMVCGYEWATTNQSAPSSTCSNTSSYTQTVTCVSRLAGGTKAPVADSFCVAADRPPTTVTGPVTTSCTYNWDADNFGPWSSTCSKSAYRYQTPVCRRSDGTVATDSTLCKATAPKSSEGPTQVVTDCGGVVANAGFETLDTAGTAFPNWTGTSTLVSKSPHGGSNALGFNRVGSVYQDVPTKVGQTYTISYWCASYNNGGSVLLYWDNTLAATCHNGSGNIVWLQSSATVKATSTTTRIRFDQTGTNSLSGSNQVRMDDVIMSPIVQ